MDSKPLSRQCSYQPQCASTQLSLFTVNAEPGLARIIHEWPVRARDFRADGMMAESVT